MADLPNSFYVGSAAMPIFFWWLAFLAVAAYWAWGWRKEWESWGERFLLPFITSFPLVAALFVLHGGYGDVEISERHYQAIGIIAQQDSSLAARVSIDFKDGRITLREARVWEEDADRVLQAHKATRADSVKNAARKALDSIPETPISGTSD